MKLVLDMIVAKDTTNGDISKIVGAIEKAGYEVEVLPTRATPRQIKIER